MKTKDPNCTCDQDQLIKFLNEETTYPEFPLRYKNRFLLDGRTEPISDCTGWRDQFPGECDHCYNKFKEKNSNNWGL